MQIANRHIKRFSTSLIIREMQIKTIWDITPYQSEWLSSKGTQKTNDGEDVVKRQSQYTVDSNVNWSSHYGKQHKTKKNSKKLKIELPPHPEIPLLGIYPKKIPTEIVIYNKIIYICTYIYNWILLMHKNNNILPFVPTWQDL